jgi:hypothetical protein
MDERNLRIGYSITSEITSDGEVWHVEVPQPTLEALDKLARDCGLVDDDDDPFNGRVRALGYLMANPPPTSPASLH